MVIALSHFSSSKDSNSGPLYPSLDPSGFVIVQPSSVTELLPRAIHYAESLKAKFDGSAAGKSKGESIWLLITVFFNSYSC